MATFTKHVCDRCGEVALRGLSIGTVDTFAEPVGYTRSGRMGIFRAGCTPPPPLPRRDLCVACAEALERWLDGA